MSSPSVIEKTQRSLVLQHSQLRKNMVLFRQENDGQLYVTIEADNMTQLVSPGALICVHNSLDLSKLYGFYNNNIFCYLTKELLDIAQHDVCDPTLGFFIRIMYGMGATKDFNLSFVEKTFVATRSDGVIHHYLKQTPDGVVLVLLEPWINASDEIKIIHNDFPLDDQADLLKFTGGTEIEHLSIADFIYDTKISTILPFRLTNKLNNLFVGSGSSYVELLAENIRATGKSYTNVEIPAVSRVSAEDAMKNVMNPSSKALQYNITAKSTKTTFMEALPNRREVILQTTADIRVGFGDDALFATTGFLLPAGSAMGFTLASTVSIPIKAVSANAEVLIVQLGV